MSLIFKAWRLVRGWSRHFYLFACLRSQEQVGGTSNGIFIAVTKAFYQ